jgi:TolB-like protein/class 3 adenylate cyclase/cytochrome c-type biogenesis protein CcmH/NrfG
VEAPQRRLAAILSADAVAYSRLMAEDEPGTVRAVREHHTEMRRRIETRRGRVVDSPGDNLLAEFPSIVEAVQCAVEIQRDVATRNQSLPETRRMHFRIGVHLGDVIVEGKHIYGDGVNVAARLEGLAEPGGVCLSGEAFDQVRPRLDLRFEELGEQRLKNIPRAVRVVRLLGAGPGARPSSSATKPGLRWRARSGALLLGAVVVVVAGYLAFERWPTQERKSSAPAAGTPIRSLAVLPLENLSGDPDQEYFADGMTEVVIGNLARLSELRVISRTSVMHYKDARKPLPEIARELGVDAVIEGAVVRAGDRVRITAQLIDARDDSHLWSESYERNLADVLALQADVAQAIARAVQLELDPGRMEQRRIDPRAYEAYLAGWAKLGVEGRAGHMQAAASFRRATDLEPEWAAAWAGLANALSCTCVWTTPAEGMARAGAAAARALALDPENAEGLAARALVQVFGDWDWEAGERSARRAVELQPSLVWARFVYAMVLAVAGDFDGAVAQGERMNEIDPLAPNPSLAFAYARRGDERRGEAEIQRSLRLAPQGSRVLRLAGEYYCESGEYAHGLALLERANELEADDSATLSTLGWCRAMSGDAAAARQILEKLDTLATSAYVDPARAAQVHLALGGREAALAGLERAFEVRAFRLPFVPRDPGFAELRDDPRFADVMRRAKLPFRADSRGSRVADLP